MSLLTQSRAATGAQSDIGSVGWGVGSGRGGISASWVEEVENKRVGGWGSHVTTCCTVECS